MKDDIDHLGNRRLRCVGELLQNQFRIGFSRMERVIRERMTIQDLDVVTPRASSTSAPSLPPSRSSSAPAPEPVHGSDQPLAELTHKRRLSALGPGGLSRERASMEVRDVHYSHYGRMCPIETPNYIVGQAAEPLDENGCLINARITARHRDEIVEVDKERVDYIDVSPRMMVSIATAMIPFLPNDDANRALMGANMQRQAVPLLRPEAPIVATGQEHKNCIDSGVVILAEGDDEVTKVSAQYITVIRPCLLRPHAPLPNDDANRALMGAKLHHDWIRRPARWPWRPPT